MLPDSLLDFLAVVKQQSGKTPQWRQKKKSSNGGGGGVLYNQKAHFWFLVLPMKPNSVP